MKRIGPTFFFELQAAGLTEGVSWGEDDGSLRFSDYVSEGYRDQVRAVLDAHDPAKPAPPFVPESVTKYQCCVVLARYNLLDATTAFFSAMAADDPRRLAWEMAPTVLRSGDATLAAAAHHGLSREQVDSMFIEAGQVGG